MLVPFIEIGISTGSQIWSGGDEVSAFDMMSVSFMGERNMGSWMCGVQPQCIYFMKSSIITSVGSHV